MIKVDCPSCASNYDLDERRLPSSGMNMRCPKCSASFKVFNDGRVEQPSPAQAGAQGAAAATTSKAPAIPKPPAPQAFKPKAPPPPPPRPARGTKSTVVGMAPASSSGLGPVQPRRSSSTATAAQASPAAAAPSAPSAPTAPPKSDAISFGELDLPAPKGAAAPAANEADFSDIDLPAPKPAAKRPLAPPVDEADFSDIDLPAPKSAAKRPLAPPVDEADFSDVDLPAPKSAAKKPLAPSFDEADFSDVDLPAPKSAAKKPLAPSFGKEPPTAAAPVMESDFSDIDLPAPREMADLPAPKNVAKKPLAPDFSVDLPAPKAAPMDVDLPAPKAAADPFGEVDLPMPKGEIDLPVPRTTDDFGVLDLPVAKGGGDLPVPRGPAADDFDLDLPEMGSGSKTGATPLVADGLDMPVGSNTLDDLALPEPRRPAPVAVDAFAGLDLPEPPNPAGTSGAVFGLGADDEIDLPLPAADGDLPMPKRGAFAQSDDLDLPDPGAGGFGDLAAPDGRSGAGGTGFGELDLDMGEEGDEMEFADIPEERESMVGLPPLSPSMPDAIAKRPLDDAPPAKQAELAPKKSGLGALGAVLGFLLLLVAAGAGLGFTPYGWFGVYYLERYLPEAGDDAAIAQQIAQAEKTLVNGTYADAKAALKLLADQRRQFGLNRALLSRSLMHEALFQARFGAQPASQARAAGITSRLEKRGFDAPFMAIARAAQALQQGNSGAAAQQAAQVLAQHPQDAMAAFILAEAQLAQGDAASAEGNFSKSAQAGGGALAQWGVVRSMMMQPDKDARAASDAILTTSPHHAGARTLAARAAIADGNTKDAVEHLSHVVPVGEGKPPQASPAEAARAWTLVGKLRADAGDRQGAHRAFDKAVKADPSSHEAFIGAGQLLLAESRPRDALSHFQTVVQANPDPSVTMLETDRPVVIEAKLGAARAMADAERAREAKQLLTPLASGEKPDPEVLETLGAIEGTLGEHAEAEKHLRASIEADKTRFGPYISLSRVLLDMERPDDASAVLTDARSAVPESADMRRLLGESELDRDKPVEAEKEFRRAVELAPRDLGARFGLGKSLRRQGKLEQAGAAFDLVAKRDGGYPGLALERGRVFEAQGAWAKAAKSYEKALVDRADDVDLLLRLGAAQVEAGEIDAAEETLTKVRKARPASAEAEFFMGRIAFARGDLAQASAHFRRALDLEQGNAEYHMYSAWAAFERGDLTGASREVDLAVKADPTFGDAYWMRARVRARGGQVRDALDDAKRAVQLNPSRSEAFAVMGDSYEQLRKQGDAIDAYRRALDADSSVGEWWYRLGRLQMDRGQRGQALEALRRAGVLGEASDAKPRWLPDAFRLIGETQRAARNKPAAIEAYRKYLSLAGPNAIDRSDVQRKLLDLGATP